MIPIRNQNNKKLIKNKMSPRLMNNKNSEYNKRKIKFKMMINNNNLQLNCHRYSGAIRIKRTVWDRLIKRLQVDNKTHLRMNNNQHQEDLVSDGEEAEVHECQHKRTSKEYKIINKMNKIEDFQNKSY